MEAMKTAHRKSAHAKQVRRADPLSFIQVISNNQVMSEEDADRTMVLIRVAFEKLKAGADDEQFDRLAGALNVGFIRSKQIDVLLEEILKRGLDALIQCDGIRLKHGRYGFTGPGLLATAEAIEAYEAILRSSTYKEMQDALTEVNRLFTSGQVREAA